MEAASPFIDPRCFSVPGCCVAVAPSGGDKTFLTKKIIENANLLFDKPVGRVVYSYKARIDFFDAFPPSVEFCKGLLGDYAEKLPKLKDDLCTLYVMDDLQSDLTEEEAVLTNVLASKQNIFVLILNQNLYPKNKWMRDISHSAGYFLLFRNRRDSSSVSILCRQISPSNWRELARLYEKSTREKHGYILIDVSPRQRYKLLVRDHLFYFERPQAVHYEE